MNAPFTTEQFLTNFEHYNVAIWPAQILAYVVGLAAVALALRAGRTSDQLIAGALATFWTWTGVVYFMVFPLGRLSAPTLALGTLFVLQAVVFIATGVVQPKLSFRAHGAMVPIVGALFVLYALAVYPLLGLLMGHAYPRTPMFGVTPCPVVIFTYGLLLWTDQRVPKYALVIPFLWSLQGLNAALSFGMVEDYGLLVAGLLGTALLVWRDRRPSGRREASHAGGAPQPYSLRSTVEIQPSRRLGLVWEATEIGAGRKRVTAFVGSAHDEGNTYKAVRQFMDDLRSFGDIDGEIVDLSQYRLETCRGCKTCFTEGEEHCPLKDDRDVLFEKIDASDGVVFASPTYVFQVSGWMKVFLDRFGFACHRPRFFGKSFTSIVTQGFVGGRSARKYLDFIAPVLGFNRVEGICLTGLDPMTENEEQKTRKAVARLSRRFHDRLHHPAYPVPSLLKLGLFRFSRKTIQRGLTEASRDYAYYRDKGWFESDYYYPVRLGAMKKVAGLLADAVGTMVATHR